MTTIDKEQAQELTRRLRAAVTAIEEWDRETGAPLRRHLNLHATLHERPAWLKEMARDAYAELNDLAADLAAATRAAHAAELSLSTIRDVLGPMAKRFNLEAYA